MSKYISETLFLILMWPLPLCMILDLLLMQPRPHLFHKKVRVDPAIFNCILDEISNNPIFHSNSNNPQLPVVIQLAIVLNRAGHYRNAIMPEDVAQWAGVSVGSVINCTNRVMVALLDQHDHFIYIPEADSEDAELAHLSVAQKTCVAWEGGIFATDGSTLHFFEKPSVYGDTFTDRKGNYSLNCQVSAIHTF